MFDPTSMNLSDHDEHLNHSHSSSNNTSIIHPFSPLLTSGDVRGQTKLSKLLKGINIDGSITGSYPKNLALKISGQKEQLKRRSSFQMDNNNKELLDDDEFVLDPVCERGLIPLLKSLKSKIRKLGLVKAKAASGSNLVLIRSRLRMRRKSDASKWSGGISHLEQITPFLRYDYVPAKTLEDLTEEKDIISPVGKKSLDRTSVRSTSLSINHSLSPEKRDQDSLRRGSTLTALVVSDLSLKLCDVKDLNLMYLEDRVKGLKDQGQVEMIKEMLLGLGIGDVGAMKTAVAVVGSESLREVTESNYGPHNSYYKSIEFQFQKNGEMRLEIPHRAYESLNLKSKTPLERKTSLNDRMKQKVHSVVEKTKTKKFTFEPRPGSPEVVASPSRQLRAHLNLGPIVNSQQHFRGNSQGSPTFSQDLEGKSEGKKEKKKTKNIRIQKIPKKKLAGIVTPELPLKTKGSLNKLNSFTDKPSLIAISFREPVVTVSSELENNMKTILLKTDKLVSQSHRASPSWGMNSSLIQQTYNNHNIKRVAQVTKIVKVKNPLAEELMPINKRKFIVPKEYGTVKAIARVGIKRVSAL